MIPGDCIPVLFKCPYVYLYVLMSLVTKCTPVYYILIEIYILFVHLYDLCIKLMWNKKKKGLCIVAFLRYKVLVSDNALF